MKKGFNVKKSGVTEVVCEINWIECKFSANLIRHCCHSNRCNTLSIDSTRCLESYSMHSFSFILFRNIHRRFWRLKFVEHFEKVEILEVEIFSLLKNDLKVNKVIFKVIKVTLMTLRVFN